MKRYFLFFLGRALYSQSFGGGNLLLRYSNRKVAPGNQVATPSNQAGDLCKSRFCCGSSNSAALTSRAASMCYDNLSSIFAQQAPNVDFELFGVPLLKAILVHGCCWSELGKKLAQYLRTNDNGRQLKKWVSSWIGYGLPDIEKSLGCTEQRATLLGFGQLKDGDAHVYTLPLPPSLSALRQWRRFTVTLAWLSPVASTTQKYRVAQLWFETGKELATSRKDADWRAVKNGTVQHEVFEGDQAVAITDGDNLRIKVNCRKDAKK